MKRFTILLLVLALAIVAGALTPSVSASGRTLFVKSAIEGPNDTVTLPLHRGVSVSAIDGKPVDVFYIILDTSDGNLADSLGVNKSQKLANAANTGAVQFVTKDSNGVIHFPGTVDFRPTRMVAPGPQGFPPAVAQPGAIGSAEYSPLIQLSNGTIVNAPHIKNDSGQSDKVINIDLANMKVTLQETNGFQGGKAVKYLSTDASFDVAAALENATYAPKLGNAPRVGDDSTHSSRTSLAACVNGATGANNPQRQGLNSALLDGLDPLNLLRWNPSQGRYSPLWDVHPAAWTDAAIASGKRVRVTAWNGQLEGLVSDGLVTGPGGAPFGAADFIVNCPIISSD